MSQSIEVALRTLLAVLVLFFVNEAAWQTANIPAFFFLNTLRALRSEAWLPTFQWI